MSLSRKYSGIFILLLVCAGYAEAQVATVYSAEGVVEVQLASGAWQAIEAGKKLEANDAIRTAANSRVALRFADGYLVRLGQKSQIRVTPKNNEIELNSGKGYFFSRQPKNFPTIRSPQVSASVRGTEFIVDADAKQTEISVLDGVVMASNNLGQVEVSRGESALAQAGQAPVKRILVDAAQSVQWALYYPAVLDLSDYADVLHGASTQQQEGFAALAEGEMDQAKRLFTGANWRDAFGLAAVAYQKGSAYEALQLLEQRRFSNAGVLLLKAALLLATGDVEAASVVLTQLDSAIAQAPQEAQARLRSALQAKQALVLLIQNKKDAAQSLLAQALKASDPACAADLVASYLEQSNNDLPAALASIKRALAKSKHSDLLHARHAELLLAMGERDLAREAIAKAGKGNTTALVVSGFIELSAYDTAAASEAFMAALKLDGSNALANLGQGLALVREGNLEQGRALLEQAALSDPLVSLYRSYLAKAYYEEDKYALADRELEQAMSLDPEDPTPYLYRAYSNLTQHKPVAALKDLQSSIERNDNRAVFRSKLLLDQDQGTRSSGLGQIYRRVGFNELARVEAMKALQKDYSNYSAHFLLGDLYEGTHLNNRAQVTENIIGRLLVPVTFSSTDLNIGGSAGLNEYTTLFDRPVSRYDVRSFADSVDKSVGAQASYSSVANDLGYKLGYTTSYRSGFRENDWLRNHQLFGQAQYQLDEDATIVVDQAITVEDKGDTIVGYDPNSENEEFERNLDSYLGRVGYRRDLDFGGQLVAQGLYNFSKFKEFDADNTSRASLLQVISGGAATADPFAIDTMTDQRFRYDQHLVRADLQYIWDSELVSVVTGVAGRYEENDGEENSVLTDATNNSLNFLDGLALLSEADVTQRSHKAYLYTTWHLLEWLDATTGASYNNVTLSENATDAPFVDSDYNNDAIDPKVGLSAQLGSSTTVRAAYTESLDRTGRGGIGSIEPTFVGGFNQVFDGVPGSEQQLWAVGLDQTITENAYVGVSYQQRDLELRVAEQRGGVIYNRDSAAATPTTFANFVEADAKIDRFSAYYYQILGDRVTASVDYSWEFFDDESVFPSTDTARFAPRINYFAQNGLFAFGQAAFRYQERGGDLTPRTYDDFWIFDLGLGYEFNKRQGAVTLTFNNILDESYSYSPITDEALLYPDFGAALDISLNF